MDLSVVPEVIEDIINDYVNQIYISEIRVKMNKVLKEMHYCNVFGGFPLLVLIA